SRYRSLRAATLLLALDRFDPAVALESLDRVVEGPEVQADELVVVADPHPGGHLVGVHRLLVEELEHGQRQRRAGSDLLLYLGHIFHMEYTKPRYTRSK